MRHHLPPLLALALLLPSPVPGQESRPFDYWQWNREVVQRGVQAVLMCNGLFTSHRTLEQVFAQELAYVAAPIGTPEGGDYQVDRERRAVAVGAPGTVPTMRAAFREGIGCVILSPEQTFEDIGSLPVQTVPPPPAFHHSPVHVSAARSSASDSKGSEGSPGTVKVRQASSPVIAS